LGAVDCSKAPAGRRVILSGAINSGRMEVQRSRRSQTGGWDQIRAGDIDLELGRVNVPTQAVLGGEVSFNNRLLYLSNRALIDLKAGSRPDGYLRMRVTDVEIKNLRIAMGPTAQPFDATLGITGQPAYFHYDLGTRNLTLSDGTFWGDNLAMGAGGIGLAGLRMEASSIKARRVELRANDSRLRAYMRGLEIEAKEVTHVDPIAKFGLAGPVMAETLESEVDASTGMAVLGASQFGSVSFSSSAISLSAGEGRELRGASGKVRASRLSDSDVDADISFDTVSLAHLSDALKETRLSALSINASGSKKAPTLRGSSGIDQVALANLGFKALQAAGRTLQFGPAQATQNTSLPFTIDVETPTGQFDLSDSKLGAALVSGKLERLKINGQLMLDNRRLRVLIKGPALTIALSAAIAAKPVIYGSIPSFAAGTLAIGAHEDLEFREGSALGTLHLSATGLALPSAEMHFDQGGIRLEAPLSANAAVRMAYDLGHDEWSLVEGQLSVSEVSARTLTDTPLSFDNLRLTNASLSLVGLSIDVRNQAATATLEEMRVTADRVSHHRAPVVSGALRIPFSLKRVTARLVQSQSKLAATDVSGEGLILEISGLEYTSNDGLKATGEGRLHADGFSLAAVRNLTLEMTGEVVATGALGGRAKLRRLQIVGDGPKDALRGSAVLEVDDLSLNARIPVVIEAPCPPLNLRADAAIGSVRLNAAIEKGSLVGAVQVPTVDVRVREDGRYRCTFDKTHHIKDQWVLFSVPCMEGWNVKMCDVTAGPIDATIRWAVDISYFETSASLTDTQVRLAGANGVKACGSQLTDLKGPFVAGAYVPTFNTGIPFINDVIAGFTVAIGYVFESPLVNAAGGLASLSNVFLKPNLLGGC
jgi:hypothetical protein